MRDSAPFLESTADVREEVRQHIAREIAAIEAEPIRHILEVRNSRSLLLKGTLSYYFHQSFPGAVDRSSLLTLASGLELLLSSCIILDNVLDGHEMRDGGTTFLQEYGYELHTLAAHYATHVGVRSILPFLAAAPGDLREGYRLPDVLNGMYRLDLRRAHSEEEHIFTLELCNGAFMSTALSLAAATASADEDVVRKVAGYGHLVGLALGIYEEVRDLLGLHGRRRATECEAGRVTLPLYHLSRVLQSVDVNQYVGHRLEDSEYMELIRSLVDEGALDYAYQVATAHLCEAEELIPGLGLTHEGIILGLNRFVLAAFARSITHANSLIETKGA